MITEINTNMKLSEHFTLRELTKTNTGIANVPNEAQVENLRRVCRWLERLRKRWNDKYGDGDDPIIINSGFRSPEVNKAVGGVPTSNHLTGCAVDIRCIGMEQALRYAAILLDISDMSREDFDELLIEQKRSVIWIHFAVRPSGNRRRTSLRLRSLLQRS
ncbi:D-Ala-D-Ala carboxypeptidase family metallohydrolase [Prevotella sp. tc2-28]|uniref:D-Ala-D-Ala carboxypeptidase family metallohydrolase n=1 Tax=Prevotella sp. tc2-28 TaxID=1761888 RepID=UPI000B8852BE|nr:D-Ala-D-Ala carboxypeptidase family metallohydrolase [Prevotella sp. tc2-28]